MTRRAGASFSVLRKVLTGSSCKRKRLEVHASHILFVWRLCSGQHFLSPLYLFSIFFLPFSYSFRLFFLFFFSSTLSWDTVASLAGCFWIDLFQNNVWQCSFGWSFLLLHYVLTVFLRWSVDSFFFYNRIFHLPLKGIADALDLLATLMSQLNLFQRCRIQFYTKDFVLYIENHYLCTVKPISFHKKSRFESMKM